MASPLAYRPDVDGIRALAVLAVLIFHAKLGLPGGYAGVDVFFVISGFLITGIILRELKTGTFSFVSFWERRIRRILPALAAATAAILAAGWFLLVPDDYRSLGRQVLALVLCASNVQLYREDGYFATRSEEKPALHTWSLSVEEQFYLAAPFLLWLAFRWNRQRAVPAILVTLATITAISFALAVYASYQKPSAAFFLLPFRAWELGVGSLLAMASPIHSPRWRSAASWAGLLMIGATFFFYPKDIRFPGVTALPPVLGTALLIWGGTGNPSPRPVPNRLLSRKPLVSVGLISYSLYLWHWPVFAFQKYLGFSMANQLTQALLALATFLPAWLSYRFVETPFRRKTIFPTTRRALAFGGITAATLVTAAAARLLSRGAEFRLSPETALIARGSAPIKYRIELKPQDIPERLVPFGAPDGKATLFVWGDSHAMALLPAINEAASELGIKGFAAAHSSTAPVLDYYIPSRWGLNELAPAFNRKVLEHIASVAKTSTVSVLLVARWKGHVTEASIGEFEQALQKTIRVLNSSQIKVLLVKEVPSFPFSPPKALPLAELLGKPADTLRTSLNAHRQAQASLDDVFARLMPLGTEVLDPAPIFSNADGLIYPADEQGSLWQDNHHLTTHGSMKTTGMLKKAFESLLFESATPAR
jgi:peptidoglycan/LPS O-acetylase OafA/YrhL